MGYFPRPHLQDSGGKQILVDHAGYLNLVEGFDPDFLEVRSTDFTELRWNQGTRKAWLIVLLEQWNRLAVDWAVGSSRNRSLALEAWQQVRRTYDAFDEFLVGTVVHQDQDSVIRSYAGPRAVILESGCVMSFSENGAKETPWIESFWGRMKNRCRSRLIESTSMMELKGVIDEEMMYYNEERRHSSLGNISPMQFLEAEGISVANITINRG
jgi:transposase InsO family protein